jgi:hypothetical protein
MPGHYNLGFATFALVSVTLAPYTPLDLAYRIALLADARIAADCPESQVFSSHFRHPPASRLRPFSVDTPP